MTAPKSQGSEGSLSQIRPPPLAGLGSKLQRSLSGPSPCEACLRESCGNTREGYELVTCA